MVKYLIKRIFYAIITLWIIATITFFLVHMLPGDPFASEKAIPPEIHKRLLEKYMLDKPLIIQYFNYLKTIISGELGISMRIDNKSVWQLIFDGFPKSFDLGMRAVLFAFFGGVSLGVVAALNRGKKWDAITMIVAVIGVSVPPFIFGGVFQWLFAVQLHLFPVAQYDTFAHTIMPSVALGLCPMAVIARMMRASMIEVLGQEYIRTAMAKGISTFRIITRHAIRNAIMPVITYMGYMIASITVGSFVIESIFVIPGLGRAYVTSIETNDYTLVLGLTIFYAAYLIVTIFIMDIIYGIINPKIRVS